MVPATPIPTPWTCGLPRQLSPVSSTRGSSASQGSLSNPPDQHQSPPPGFPTTRGTRQTYPAHHTTALLADSWAPPPSLRQIGGGEDLNQPRGSRVKNKRGREQHVRTCPRPRSRGPVFSSAGHRISTSLTTSVPEYTLISPAFSPWLILIRRSSHQR